MGDDLPVDTEVATVFRSARAAIGAVLFGPACEHPVPAQVAERFSIRSTMVMAVYPKVDQPYLFGLHQCSHPREWTTQETRLFEEIGRRLADALTSLLVVRGLRESERKLEEAQRIAHVGYWEADIDGGRLTLSDEASRIYGLQTHELPHWQARLDLVHPEDRERLKQAHESAVQGDSRFELEYRVLQPNGEVRIVHSRAEVAQDASTQPRRIFGMVQDVTELRRAEEALREVQMELAHANRVAALGQLTASIAHEVNQPIAGVLSSGNAALRWLDKGDLDALRRSIERVIRDATRAGDVIGRLRVLFTRGPQRSGSFDMNEAIREVVVLTRGEMVTNGISVETQLAKGLPLVRGDRVQMLQVMLNLIINAIEAMSAVREGQRELLIKTAKSEPDSVLVAVQDSGPGLDPATAERIFEAFYTTKPEGLGMGLSICRSIVEAHGGTLAVSANVPHGAIFQVRLPMGGDA